jgi:exonuclease SbcC
VFEENLSHSDQSDILYKNSSLGHYIAVKILRIKLRNLNSLRGEHVVDFTQEPLASCGIFAITGPTGAGKSTLLDAMTLALYGKAARYLSESNPENMMSRHTADCLAEVTFSVNQSPFRAEWQLRRARGKIDGAIQPPTRFLYDSTNTPLNRTGKEFDAEIEKLTGLDYPRFLRSVLLAQGEFSRFLKASAEERAALLESLTGTEIYTDLGKLAHEEAGRREKALDVVKIALQQYQLLTDEEIAAKKESMAKAQTDLATLQSLVKQQQQQWQQAEQRKKTEIDLDSLAQQKIIIEKEAQEHAEWREQWRMHQLAVPFSNALLRYDHALQVSNQCKNSLTKSTEEHIGAKEQHAQQLHRAIEFVTKRITANEDSKKSILEAIQNIETHTKNITNWLAEHTHWLDLSENISRLSEQANQLRNLHSLQRETQSQLQLILADLQKTTEQQKQSLAAQQLCQHTLTNKQTELTSAQQALKLLIAADQTPDTIREHWQQQLQTLQRCLDSITQLQTLSMAIATHESNLNQTQKSYVTAREQFEQSKTTLEECASQHRLRQDHYRLAEQQASFEEHRSQLHEGDPCPLCGALEHPLAHQPHETLTLPELRKALEKSELILQQAQQHHTNLQSTMLEAKALADSKQQQLLDLKKQLTTSKADLKSASYAEATQESLLVAIDQLAQQQKKLSIALEAERQAQLAHHEAEAHWKLAQQQCATLQQSLEEKHQQQQHLQETVTQRQQAIAASQQNLEILLAPYHLPMPDFASKEFSLSEWEKAATHHPRAQQKLANFQNDNEKLQSQSQNLSEELSQLQECLTEWRNESNHYPHMTESSPQPPWQTLRDAETACQQSQSAVEQCNTTLQLLQRQSQEAQHKWQEEKQHLLKSLTQSPFSDIDILRGSLLPSAEEQKINAWQTDWQTRQQSCKIAITQRRSDLQLLINAGAPDQEAIAILREALQQSEQQANTLSSKITLGEDVLSRDTDLRAEYQRKTAEVAEQLRELETWQILRSLIGSHDGAKFRKFAQGISLDILLNHANQHLRNLSERYRLQRQAEAELTLEIIDLYQANCCRPMASLSGGESFIVSLALALGLSDLAGRNVQIDSLFIDEGFGTLDADALDTALSTLESLHQQNKIIGIISHIDLLKERIRTKINIRKLSAGSSTVEVA